MFYIKKRHAEIISILQGLRNNEKFYNILEISFYTQRCFFKHLCVHCMGEYVIRLYKRNYQSLALTEYFYG